MIAGDRRSALTFLRVMIGASVTAVADSGMIWYTSFIRYYLKLAKWIEESTVTEQTALARPSPETTLERIESWSDLPEDERKRRAAAASQQIDRKSLRGLLFAYVGLFGRRGTDTSPRTIKTYWQGARRLLDWCERKGKKPHQLDQDDAQKFKASMADLKVSSRQVYLTGARTLYAALGWAGLGDGDAFEGVAVTDPTTREEKADPYTAEELADLLAAANAPRERAFIVLASDAGLRVSEAAAVRWEDVDFERGRLTVEGKGGKAANIKLTPRTVDALRALDGERSGPVFPSPQRTEDGRTMSISARRVQQIFAAVARRAQVNARGYHNLRHTCGTLLYADCRDLQVVKRHLRHSSVTTTELYAHLAAGDYENAIESFGSAQFSENGKHDADSSNPQT